jgi:hypothetical protein
MKKFKKTLEDFTCLVCKEKVSGTGFTDHCPSCLWSRHVDINPGDRSSKCKGLMEPIGATNLKGEWKIFYKCQKCGFTHFNKAADDDNMELIIKISSRPIPS